MGWVHDLNRAAISAQMAFSVSGGRSALIVNTRVNDNVLNPGRHINRYVAVGAKHWPDGNALRTNDDGGRRLFEIFSKPQDF